MDYTIKPKQDCGNCEGRIEVDLKPVCFWSGKYIDTYDIENETKYVPHCDEVEGIK